MSSVKNPMVCVSVDKCKGKKKKGKKKTGKKMMSIKKERWPIVIQCH